MGTAPVEDRRARIADLQEGVYRLVLARQGEPLASLYFDLRTQA